MLAMRKSFTRQYAASTLDRRIAVAAAGDYKPDALWPSIRELENIDSDDWPRQIERMRSAFSSAVHKLGVRYFSYQIVRCPSIGPSIDCGALMVTTNPEDWVQYYSDEGYAGDDPILAHLIDRDQPIKWAQASLSNDLTERQRNFFEEARRCGLGECLTMPIRVRHGVGALGITPHSGSVAAVQQASDILYLMAHYFHQKIYRPLVETATVTSARRASLLTARETQVLETVAQGKSTKEASSELGLSVKGVDFHVESVKRKLQVANRTHAVAKAIMLGLITLK
jgi:LuxR family quorum-sensing system transcriptional regulator SolR